MNTMKKLAALIALALPVHAATESRTVEVSFYCFKYAPGVETVQVTNGETIKSIRLSTANITDPVSLPVADNQGVILKADKTAPAAKLKIPAEISKALVVLMPAPSGSTEPYHAFALDYGHEKFPLGTYRLVNVSKHAVRGAIGRSYAEVKPGGVAGLELQGENGATQRAKFEFLEEGKWNRLTETRCAVRRDRRWLVCVYQDPATKRMNLRSIPDRTVNLVTASNETVAISE